MGACQKNISDKISARQTPPALVLRLRCRSHPPPSLCVGRLPPMSDYDAAIVGGGLWGLALAWHLAQGHKRVVVLEQRHTGSGASSRNVGRIRSIQLTPELTRLAVAAQA